jgi:hypothetical protein
MRFALLLLVSVVVLGVGAAAASADDTGSSDDAAQLLDVSKQVNGIEQKLAELLARGDSSRTGKLFADADCGYDAPSQVFAAWGDAALYWLAPEGDLASADGWTLNKQADVDADPGPFSGAGRSLLLGKGGVAATPAMCVGLDNPSIRFFSRDAGGNGKANLKVDVLYEDFGGHVKHLTIARLKAGSEWQPSLVVPMYMNMLAAASPDGVTAVAFRFKAEGLQKDETLSISSLYVDPYCSR